MKKTSYCRLLFSLAAITITLVGCQKDEIGKTTYSPDTTAPTIEITSPATGAFNSASALVIRGTVTDNKELHSLHLELRNANSSNVIWQNEPYVHDLEAYDLDIAVSPQTLTAGQTYVLTARAEDHVENVRTVVVQFVAN